MKPAPFSFFAPASLPEAISQLAALGPEAKLLAGGQSLVPAMNMRMARPSAIVDLGNIPELCYIREEADGVRIGAMTRQRVLERSEKIRRRAPLISLALPHVAHFQIRNRGTLGGSIAHNDPAAELPAVVAALDGTVTLSGPGGQRQLGWRDFLRGVLDTAAEPDEIVTSIHIPSLPEDTGYGFAEISRRHGDFALVGAAATIHLDAKASVDIGRLVLFGIGDGPVRAHAAERCLRGASPGDALWREAADMAAKEIDPRADLHASATYRREASAALAHRVLRQAWDEVRGLHH